MRTCIECHRTRPDEDFPKCGHCSDTDKPKRRPRCNDCHYQWSRQQRAQPNSKPQIVLEDTAAVWATRRMA